MRVRPSPRSLAFALLALAGAAASALATAAAPSALNWRERAPGPDATAPLAPPKRRVLFAVVDGLGRDEAKAIAELEALAGEGASADVEADPPTFSAAQYVSLLCGVTPQHSGVRTNLNIAPVPLPSLASGLRARGGRAVALSDDTDWWGRMFEGFDVARVAGPTPLDEEARAHLPNTDLLLLHPTNVDSAGHREGALSNAYREQARLAVRAVLEVWRRFRGDDAALVIASDHGHMPRGGHGGDEPDVARTWLVLSGAGVRRGAVAPAALRTIDVASTVAALVGAPSPAVAEGRTAVELLALSEAERRRALEADAERIRRAGAHFAEVSSRRSRDERRSRLLRLGAVVAALGLFALTARRRRAGLRGVPIGAAALLLTGLLVFAVLGGVSFSAAPLMGKVVARVAVISLFANLAVWALAWRRVRAHPAELEWASLGALVGASPAALSAFVLYGAFAERWQASPGWVAAAPAYAYAAFGASALAVAALLFGRHLRSRRPLRRPDAEAPLRAPLS